ncbi:MAG: PAS domain S-box protein [Thermoplasmata archaeon]|nr:MAG: PAS domain S-box protein [Thermoplasmata archaeon]
MGEEEEIYENPGEEYPDDKESDGTQTHENPEVEEIRRQKDVIEKIIISAPSIIVGTDLQGNITIFNAEAEKVSGLPSDKVVGKSFTSIMVSEKERLDTSGIFALSTEIGTFYNIERHLINKEGDERLISWCIGPMLDESDDRIGVIFVGSDVSEKEIIESLGELAELAPENNKVLNAKPSQIGIQVEDSTLFEGDSAAEKEWENAFNSIADPIIIINKENTILKINNAYASKIDSQPEELIGKKCCDVFHNKNSPIHNCLHKNTFDTEREYSEEVRDPDSGETTLISCFPYHDDYGEFLGSIIIARDIPKSSTPQTIPQKPKRMRDMDALISAISHEINNPLGGLIGYAEAMMEEEDPIKMRFYSKEIKDGADRVQRILSSLSKFSQRQQKEGMETLDLNEMIEKSLSLMKESGKLDNVDVEKDLSHIPKIQGIPMEIQQVFIYLLTNSKLAMEEGGKIQISTRTENGKIQAILKDQGEGVPNGHLAWMFDPSFTPETEGSESIYDKMKIGLRMHAISSILKKHNAPIDIESKEGMGRTFVINFPQIEISQDDMYIF